MLCIIVVRFNLDSYEVACRVLQKALRTGTSTRLDERVFAMCEFKSQPLHQIILMVHPDLYRIDNMTEQVLQNIQVCSE